MGGSRPKENIKFIVVHWTGNTSPTADAMNHYKYLQNAVRYGSAHYYVDKDKIIQTIGDGLVAWAVGDNQGYGTALNGCTNYNSISIEMCWNEDTGQVIYNTIELVKELLRLYPNAKVCRHWDVSRKDCPHEYAGKNNAKWNAFLNKIKEPRKLILDLSKDSVAKEVNKEVNKMETKKKIVVYLNDGDKLTADYVGAMLGLEVYKDDGSRTSKDYEIVYVGGKAQGKNRFETAKYVINKWF